jgi:hypothetical protein
MMWWLTGTLIATACLVALAGIIAKKRTEQLRTQEKCREEFYGYAERLLSDPETPDGVEQLILSMARSEESRSFLWGFVVSAISGKLADSTDSAALRMYRELPPHLRSDFVGAIIAFFLGITNNNMLLGPLARRLMFFSVPRRGGGDIGPISPVGPMLDEFSRGAKAA